MKVYLRKTYLLKFEHHEHFHQFSLELKNEIFSKIVLNTIRYKGNLYYICKIPTHLEGIIPHIQEFCFLKQIKSVEEAYLKEYGKIIKP